MNELVGVLQWYDHKKSLGFIRLLETGEGFWVKDVDTKFSSELIRDSIFKFVLENDAAKSKNAKKAVITSFLRHSPGTITDIDKRTENQKAAVTKRSGDSDQMSNEKKDVNTKNVKDNAKDKSKVGIIIQAHPVIDNKVNISVVVTKDVAPLENVSLVLFQNGAVIPGAFGTTDSLGKFEFTFTTPEQTPSMRIKAELAYNGVVSKEVTVSVPPKTTLKVKSPPIIVVDDNKIEEGKYRLAIAAFHETGAMYAGNINFSTNRSVAISYPLVQNSNDSNSKIDNTTAHTFTLDGKSHLIIDVEYEQAFELDLFLDDYNSHLELEYPAPKNSVSDNLVPLTRPIFAGIYLFIFLVSFFTGSFMSYPTSWLLAGIIAIIVTFFAYLAMKSYNRDVIEKKPINELSNQFFASFLKTNNRLLIVLIFLTMCSAIMLFIAQWGDPIVPSDNRTALTEVEKKNEYIPGDQAQRMRNFGRNLGARTDRELIKQNPAVTWESFLTRLGCFLVLLVFTISYILIAYSDEAQNAFKFLWTKIGSSRTEGDSRPGFIERLTSYFSNRSQVKPVIIDVENSTSTKSNQGSSLAGSLASGIGASVIVNILIEFVEEVVERVMKRGRDNRRHKQS